jgi:hypothetical protein
MLALNITTSLRGLLDDRPRDVQACAERWWAVSETTRRDYADDVLAVADNIIVGVFAVRGWVRDPANGDKVVFQLAPAARWQFLIGRDSPVTWIRGQANPVRKLGTVLITELRRGEPQHIEVAHGWSLDVGPDGKSATVRGPGTIVITDLQNASARLAVA